MNPGAAVPPETARSVGVALVAWYLQHGRDLPWRRRGDPWAVWVSEVMLQQTTVAAVIPRFEAFLERFPDVRAVAESSEETLLEAVQGLGYYRRFRALRRAATTLVEERDARLPESLSEWRSLPGVGEYTAGAVASIAQGERAAAVDGNVQRVLSRLFAIRGRLDGAAARRRLGALALDMMPEGRASEFNQALFDLGATVCTPRKPQCPTCPVGAACRARRAGTVEEFPETAPRPAPVARLVPALLVENEGRVLFVRRPRDVARMPGFWELPEVWTEPGKAPAEALAEHVRERLGVEVEVGEELARARHSITRHRLDCRLFAGRLRGALAAARDRAWLSEAEFGSEARPLSTLSRKLLRAWSPRDGSARGDSRSRRAPTR